MDRQDLYQSLISLPTIFIPKKKDSFNESEATQACFDLSTWGAIRSTSATFVDHASKLSPLDYNSL